MKLSRVKTESYHNYEEGDAGKPKDNYFKKGFWKKYDRKRYIKSILREQSNDENLDGKE